MRLPLSLLGLGLVAALPLMGAESATPAATAPGPGGPRGGPGWGGPGGGDMMQRMIAENPELKGVDPSTPEGREKIGKVMAARMAPMMRQRMAEAQAQTHQQIREAFAMSAEDFTAVEPLITRVEGLRFQKQILDGGMAPMGGGGRRGGMGGGMGGGPGGPPGMGGPGGMWNPRNMLGDTPIDPAVQEIEDANKGLKTLLEDAQANAAEVTQALARLRAARAAYTTSLNKAQEDLRSVLTPKQEAVLVSRSVLE